jgi:hypothetical protein
MMNYVQSSYTELNDRYQVRIFEWISASALGRREPKIAKKVVPDERLLAETV